MRALMISAGIVAVLIALSLVVGGEARWQSLDQDDLMHLAYAAVLASFVGIGFFSGGFRNLREDLKALLFWVAALVIVAALYGLRHDLKALALRTAGVFVPGMVVNEGRELVVTRGRGGMFLVDGAINGTDVRFLFDTGASGISIAAEDAKRAGITPPPDAYRIPVMTANGEAQVAPVTLARLKVGPIELVNVKATVSKPGALGRSLLGHGFLNELKSYEVSGDRLILRAE